jgi:hypothetical protein
MKNEVQDDFSSPKKATCRDVNRECVEFDEDSKRRTRVQEEQYLGSHPRTMGGAAAGNDAQKKEDPPYLPFLPTPTSPRGVDCCVARRRAIFVRGTKRRCPSESANARKEAQYNFGNDRTSDRYRSRMTGTLPRSRIQSHLMNPRITNPEPSPESDHHRNSTIRTSHAPLVY